MTALHEARFYEPLPDGKVLCTLCPHDCRIADGGRGVCAVRYNAGGKLYTLVYDKVVARNLEPIEKKPLFHFHPGSTAYSIATVGCCLRCAFCQNWEISQWPKAHLPKRIDDCGNEQDAEPICPRLANLGAEIPGEPVTPAQIVEAALRSGARTIAYTFTEPTIFYELAVDTARLAKAQGLKNVFVTSGYGPTVPVMLGLRERPIAAGERLVPPECFGLKAMSIGFLIEEDQPVIWRGPMVSKALMELMGKVAWGVLDCLVVDLPPGTGDPSITVARALPKASVIIVTTPQTVAIADVRKAVAMFRRLGTPIVGIVENMAWFCCAHSEERIPIFGSGGGEALSRELKIPLLASLPIDLALRESGDLGQPLTAAQPDAPASRAFAELAERVARGLG